MNGAWVIVVCRGTLVKLMGAILPGFDKLKVFFSYGRCLRGWKMGEMISLSFTYLFRIGE